MENESGLHARRHKWLDKSMTAPPLSVASCIMRVLHKNNIMQQKNNISVSL